MALWWVGELGQSSDVKIMSQLSNILTFFFSSLFILLQFTVQFENYWIFRHDWPDTTGFHNQVTYILIYSTLYYRNDSINGLMINDHGTVDGSENWDSQVV